MKTLTIVAASLLTAAVSAHAGNTTPEQSVAMPYGAPHTIPAPEHFQAHQARIQAIHQEQFKAHQAAMEQMTKMQEDMARMRQGAFQAPAFDGPMTRADIDAMFEERRQEMDARFAEAAEEMEAARENYGQDYTPDRRGMERPEFPAAFDDGRYEEHLKRVEAGRKAAEERMAEMRAAAEQARAARYAGPVL